jgi:flagellar basal-body rod modification protein FlgD
MATSSIAAPGSVQSAAAGLRLDDLLRVLMTELTHQNPLKPVDNKDFMAQIAQFASLESTQQLNDSIGQLTTLQAITQSVGLIGRKVSVSIDGGVAAGTVTALALDNGVPRMTVQREDGSFIPNVALGQLLSVRQ